MFAIYTFFMVQFHKTQNYIFYRSGDIFKSCVDVHFFFRPTFNANCSLFYLLHRRNGPKFDLQITEGSSLLLGKGRLTVEATSVTTEKLPSLQIRSQLFPILRPAFFPPLETQPFFASSDIRTLRIQKQTIDKEKVMLVLPLLIVFDSQMPLYVGSSLNLSTPFR